MLHATAKKKCTAAVERATAVLSSVMHQASAALDQQANVIGICNDTQSAMEKKYRHLEDDYFRLKKKMSRLRDRYKKVQKKLDEYIDAADYPYPDDNNDDDN
jgi:predicted  nucleic acid-binding Zn-ribbon protein